MSLVEAMEPSESSSRVTIWRRRAGTVMVIVLLVLLAYAMWTRPKPDSPVLFLHATLISNTGTFYSDMTVGVADGVVRFVGEPGVTAPAIFARARRVDTLGAWLAAATFDPSASSPVQGLKHLWVGQLYDGAPGDVVLTPVPQRGRGGAGGAIGNPSGRQIFGAVVKGRYYAGRELR